MSKNVKVLVIGDNNVGKTSICRRYVHCVFNPNVKSTRGFDIFLKSTNFCGNRFNLIFWDIAGPEHNIKFYKDASFCVIVFSLTNRNSFQNILKWKSQIDNYIKKPIPFLLIGNMSDIPDYEVSDDEIMKLSIKYKFLTWFKTSAKTNSQINKFVERMLMEC